MKKCSLEEILNKCENVIIGKKGCPDCVAAILVMMCKEKCFAYCSSDSNPDILKELPNRPSGCEQFPAIYIDKKICWRLLCFKKAF